MVNPLPPGLQTRLDLGDCSAEPLLNSGQVAEWTTRFERQGFGFSYTFFGENLGFGRGHNRLFFGGAGADRLLVLNPDAVVPFHLLARLNRQAEVRPDWGIIEARQIPFENAKHFDPITLETTQAIGACALYEGSAFRQCAGYDETFFLYSEDVDLSWRIRALGRKIYFAVDTFIYHSKRVNERGFEMSEAEQYYSLLAWLILRVKYGRPDLNLARLKWMRDSAPTDPVCARALQEWETLKPKVKLATAPQRAAAYFNETGGSSPRRWQL